MALTPDTLVNKSLDLVSSPTIYAQLTTLVQDEKASALDLSAVINADPALATRLLKVVNSPYYGFPSQVRTINRAVTIIGTSELIQLVLATSIINSFEGIPNDLIDMDNFWQHSVACALAASIIARECKMPGVEHFFTAGLLHNIGALVLYQSVPEIAREAISSAQYGSESLFQAESRLLGFDHAAVGEALTRKWGLPTSLCEITRFHHQPSQAKDYKLEATIIHLADIIVTSTAQFGHSGDRHVPPLDEQAWSLLPLSETVLPAILQEVTDKIDDLTSALTK